MNEVVNAYEQSVKELEAEVRAVQDKQDHTQAQLDAAHQRQRETDHQLEAARAAHREKEQQLEASVSREQGVQEELDAAHGELKRAEQAFMGLREKISGLEGAAVVDAERAQRQSGEIDKLNKVRAREPRLSRELALHFCYCVKCATHDRSIDAHHDIVLKSRQQAD